MISKVEIIINKLGGINYKNNILDLNTDIEFKYYFNTEEIWNEYFVKCLCEKIFKLSNKEFHDYLLQYNIDENFERKNVFLNNKNYVISLDDVNLSIDEVKLEKLNIMISNKVFAWDNNLDIMKQISHNIEYPTIFTYNFNHINDKENITLNISKCYAYKNNNYYYEDWIKIPEVMQKQRYNKLQKLSNL